MYRHHHRRELNFSDPKTGPVETTFLYVITLLVALLLCTGCGKNHEKPDVSALKITRYRLNLDDAHDIARIMAEMTNFGDDRFEKVRVTAALQGPGERDYEANTTTINNIKPREARAFTIAVDDLKGKERDVKFSVSLPANHE